MSGSHLCHSRSRASLRHLSHLPLPSQSKHTRSRATSSAGTPRLLNLAQHAVCHAELVRPETLLSVYPVTATHYWCHPKPCYRAVSAWLPVQIISTLIMLLANAMCAHPHASSALSSATAPHAWPLCTCIALTTPASRTAHQATTSPQCSHARPVPLLFHAPRAPTTTSVLLAYPGPTCIKICALECALRPSHTLTQY